MNKLSNVKSKQLNIENVIWKLLDMENKCACMAPAAHWGISCVAKEGGGGI